jgi:hypothetical protein
MPSPPDPLMLPISQTRMQAPEDAAGPATAQYHPPSSPSSFAGNLAGLRNFIARSQTDNVPPIVDGYKLLEEIGHGGFGSVWTAQDVMSDEIVAIKFLVSQSRDTSSLLDEVRHLASVQGCFGVVPIKTVKDRGIPPHHVPYYVMQYASQGSLASRLKSQGPMTAAELVNLMLPITRAMGYIHDRQIVHSDLKPANVLLNEANEPLIADFGQAQRSKHSSGQGTLFYMAPERATAEKLRPDPRWDVYSLGAMMYALLTGSPPRLSTTLNDKLSTIASYEERLDAYRVGIINAPKPVDHRKHCDSDLARIIDRCIAIAPGERFLNAEAVCRALRQRNHQRRIKPIIRFGVAACVLLLLMVAVVGAILGRSLITYRQNLLAQSIEESLYQKVFLGTQIVTDAIADRINFVEYHANHPSRCPHEIRTRLAAMSEAIVKARHDATIDPHQLIKPADRDAVDQWLVKDCYSVLARRLPDAVKNVGLIAVVPDAAHPDRQFGHYLSRVGGEGREGEKPTTDPVLDRTHDTLGNPKIYKRSWAFRDYFNGTGNKFKTGDDADAETRSYPVIRATHVSLTYRSQAKSTVKNAGKSFRWKIDIATPIWSEPRYDNGPLQPGTGTVVAVLVCGIDLEEDIRSKFLWTNEPFISTTDTSRRDQGVSFVLINERNQWVMHDAARRQSLIDEAADDQVRDPEPITAELAEKVAVRASCQHLFSDARTTRVPESTHEMPMYQSSRFMDLFELDSPLPPGSVAPGSGAARGPVRTASDLKESIAVWGEFNPFEYSIYKHKAERQSAAPWKFLAKVDREEALAPVEAMVRSVFHASIAMACVLMILTAGLWWALFRVLKRQEFVGHG